MKRIFMFGSLAISLLLTAGCYRVIEPGHVGILVEQTGAQRGVQDFPTKTGRVFYNPFNEYVLEYPTNIMQYTWTHEVNEGHPQNEEMCFKSSDFLMFCADVNAAFHVEDAKAPSFYVKFRSDDIDSFIHGFFKNVLRDNFTHYASLYTSDDLNGGKQQELLDRVMEGSRTQLGEYGVDLVTLGFAHPPRPPAEVQSAITAKLTATQDAIRVENEVRKVKAEAEKTVAAAQGRAEANRVEMMSITPQLIQMRTLEKWNGVLPQVTGGGMPLLNLTK